MMTKYGKERPIISQENTEKRYRWTSISNTGDEARVIAALENGEQLSSSEIAKATGYTKSKVLRLIDHLKEKDYIRVTGKGRGTRYGL